MGNFMFQYQEQHRVKGMYFSLCLVPVNDLRNEQVTYDMGPQVSYSSHKEYSISRGFIKASIE